MKMDSFKRKMHKYYIYILKNPLNNNLPFYIGKGSGRRCHFHTWAAKKNYDMKNPHKERLIKLILKAKLEPIIDIIFTTDDEDECLIKEKYYILKIGRKNLTNLTDGGEKNPMSNPEIRERSRLFHLGRKRSRLTKSRIRLAKKGVKLSNEHKKNIIKTLIGNCRAGHKVLCIDNKGTETTFDSISKAAIYFNVSQTLIWRFIKIGNKKGHIKNHIFKRL